MPGAFPFPVSEDGVFIANAATLYSIFIFCCHEFLFFSEAF